MENMDKELFLKMYADIQENSKVMARVEEKVNNFVVVTEQQQKQINKLIEDNIKNQQDKEELKKISNKLDGALTRIDSMEKKSGQVALGAWKKIGLVILTVVVTAVTTGVINAITTVLNK